VLEQFDDGRLNILVEGTTPFRMERRIGELAYPAGDVVLLDDEPDTDDEALERTRTTYADLVEEVTDSRPEPETLSGLGAYGMAATVDINPAAKQSLLELRSEPARLEQLEGLFAEALRRIRTATKVAEQASGNGHLKPGE
jgi:Lon protease-like protein